MINNILYTTPQIYTANQNKNISFKGGFHNIETLKYTNIGNCLEGYIGKVCLRKASNNEECFMNVFKKLVARDVENYSIRNDNNEILGEADIVIKKYYPGSYDSYYYKEDPSHVFVDRLNNYSKPGTPMYNDRLEYIKDIGTRLLQIAQRRSDEAQCVGNIKLMAKGEAKTWYIDVIGMMQEFPPETSYYSKIGLNPHNPNLLYLPPHSKEPLSKLHGGL